jgi:hypothetical protein
MVRAERFFQRNTGTGIVDFLSGIAGVFCGGQLDNPPVPPDATGTGTGRTMSRQEAVTQLAPPRSERP